MWSTIVTGSCLLVGRELIKGFEDCCLHSKNCVSTNMIIAIILRIGYESSGAIFYATPTNTFVTMNITPQNSQNAYPFDKTKQECI